MTSIPLLRTSGVYIRCTARSVALSPWYYARRSAAGPWVHLLQWPMNPPSNGSDRTTGCGLPYRNRGC